MSALAIGSIDIIVKLVNNLNSCSPADRGACLRALVNSQGLIYRELVQNILEETGELLLEWLQVGDIGLTSEEGLRIMASIKKAQGKMDWFEPGNEGTVVI